MVQLIQRNGSHIDINSPNLLFIHERVKMNGYKNGLKEEKQRDNFYRKINSNENQRARIIMPSALFVFP